MEQWGWSSRCSHTVAGQRDTPYKIVFSSLKEDSKASEASPWAASLAPCCANMPKSKTVQTWGQKCNAWLHPTSLRPTPSTCTSLFIYIWLPVEEKKKGREREKENRSRMKFPWGHLSTFRLCPADIVHISTMPSLVHATALPTWEPITTLGSRRRKTGFNVNTFHDDAANQHPVCNGISCKTQFICRSSNN